MLQYSICNSCLWFVISPLIVHTGSEGMNEARVELLDTKKCTLMCAVAPVETLENIEWIRVVYDTT